MIGKSFETRCGVIRYWVSAAPDRGLTLVLLPGLTADHRLMLEQSQRIVDGLRAAMRALDVKKGIIAIEDNKPKAIEAMKKAAAEFSGAEIRIIPLKTKYPQGSEKQLINAVTGRKLKPGALPWQAGCIVSNIDTVASIARAVVNEPRVLFADEPTGALNRKNTTEVLGLLTDLNRDGQSIVMVTHDMRAALRATRLLYLEDGKVIGELSLPPYDSEEEKSRETQVNAWLSSMKW